MAQTEAEGEGDIALEGVEETITHVDVLLVVGIGLAGDGHLVAYHQLQGVLVELTREVLRRSVVGSGDGPGHRELAGGIHLAREQVGDGVAALHTGLPGAEDGIGIAAP